MGYRSDVVAVFYGGEASDVPAIKLWLAENFPFDAFDDYCDWFENGLLFRWDGVKWYSDFPEVKKFMDVAKRFIEQFCSGEGGAARGGYEFVRIGEDYTDIETQYDGDCQWILSVNRSIEIDI